MKTLLRSWFFRIFAGMAIFGLSVFNIAMNIEASGAPWIYRALSCSIPYANLIILNLGQAIVAIFLASEFLKQDKKNDTIEVIYARSMTNGDYILGKTLGILLVFFILNVLVLVLGIGFSFLSNDTSRSVLSLFAYPLLISLPTLIFIFGLSFFLMILLKNQAVTFLVLLGYIALTVFYLSSKVYHVFDFIAYHVPMMYSNISGFGNLTEILLHRSIFLFAGIALIFFTIYKLPRLPQSRTFELLPLVFAVFFFVISGFITFQYIDLKKDNEKFKEQLINLNNQYSNYPTAAVTDCEINFEHSNESIKVNAKLILQNQTNLNIDTLILRLNPLLTIGSVKLNNSETDFTRNLHLIKIAYTKKLKPNETLNLEINYHGGINENVCFIDQNSESYTDNYTLDMFNLRKRYAFIQNHFVCLTSEALWYPQSGAGYATNKPLFYHSNFTRYLLRVKTNKELTPISQGESVLSKDGVYTFKPENPLPKISLVIGNYIKHSIIVDSVDYRLYCIKGNQYFETYFKDINDTISSVIKSLRRDIEVQTKLIYPFPRFSLVEVPVLFALDKHTYSIASDAVQPEMVFYPEKGVMFEESDFRKRKRNTERDMKHNNEEILPEELQTRMFQKFVQNNFMAKPGTWFRYAEIKDGNTFTLFPQFYTFTTKLNSEKWPILYFALEGWMKEKSGTSGGSGRWFFEGMTKPEKINVKLLKSSLEQLINNGIVNKPDDRNPVLLKDVVLSKGVNLFDTWNVRFGQVAFTEMMFELVAASKFRSLTVSELDSSVQSRFGQSILPDIEKWYSQDMLPGFIIKDLSTYKIIQKEITKYQLRFKISNPEPVDGMVTINVELNDPSRGNNRNWWDGQNDVVKSDYSKSLYIAANTAKEVGIVFNTLPERMAVLSNVSKNLPNVLRYDFTGFNELKKIPDLDTIIGTTMFFSTDGPKEIIVDNEDIGFSVEEAENQAYLKSLFNKRIKTKFEYNQIMFWDIPGYWDPVLQTGFYGKYIHSAYYTKAGLSDRKAIWSGRLKESGFYDVYFYYYKVDNYWRGQKTKESYVFDVFHDGGIEKMTISEMDNGWNYLGSYYISTGKAKVELSNKTVGEMVFADAMKWVKTK